jgi:iron complex outermembrane receptor protein
VFLKSTSPTGGTSGFFNDPRTFGAEINIKM